jgi:hypothetical protein
MDWRNPQLDAAGNIVCEIEHPVLGWIPFTVIEGDTGADFDVDTMRAEILVDDNIAPYAGPSAAEIARGAMAPLSRRQTFIMLAEEGFLTDQEAEDAAAGNAVPASIAATFDALVTAGTWGAADRRAARITFLSFTEAYRTDPMIPLFVASADPAPTDADLDTWWGIYANV